MTRRVVAVLRGAGVENSSLMVVARHDIRLDELPVAGVDKTDAIPGFTRGVAAGGLGGLLSGASVPSSRLKRFRHAIEHDGKVLLMLDVRKERGKELEKLVEREVPEVEFVGFEPRAPFVP